ncbi:unnamed protein product, partial [Closterium sp. Naga37s-1]
SARLRRCRSKLPPKMRIRRPRQLSSLNLEAPQQHLALVALVVPLQSKEARLSQRLPRQQQRQQRSRRGPCWLIASNWGSRTSKGGTRAT